MLSEWFDHIVKNQDIGVDLFGKFYHCERYTVDTIGILNLPISVVTKIGSRIVTSKYVILPAIRQTSQCSIFTRVVMGIVPLYLHMQT